MERRFNDQLREHEASEYAHSAMRHNFISDTLAPATLQHNLDHQVWDKRLMTLEAEQRAGSLAAARAEGESIATRRILRFWGSVISVLVTAFGTAILFKLGVL